MTCPQSGDITLDDVLITEELSRRPAREPNWRAESEALRSLTRQLVHDPEVMLQSLVDWAIELCGGRPATAGVSLVEATAAGDEIFRWVALAGNLADQVGNCQPREFSPYGVCLDQGTPVLFSHPERYFTYLQAFNTPFVETLVLPLMAEAQPLGAIWIVSHDKGRRFDGEDVRLMSGLADFAAAALLRNQQYTQELRSTNTHLEAETVDRQQAKAAIAADLRNTRLLHDLTMQVNSGDQEQDLFQRILDTAIALMHADMGSLQILNPERNELYLQSWRGFHPDAAVGWQIVGLDDGSSCGAALKAGERVIVADTETCDFIANTDDLEFYRLCGTRAVQLTPLLDHAGQFIGMMSTHWRKPHRPTERELRFLDLLARQAADLIEQRQAEAALRESEVQLAADLVGMRRLYDLYTTLATGLDLKTALDEILAIACEFTHTERGCIQLISDDGTRLEMYNWRGYADDSPFINHFRYEGFKEGCDRARVARQRFLIEETIGFPGLAGTEAGAAAYAEGIRAAQSTPIINRSNETIGVLSTQFSHPHRPSDDDLRLVDLLAWTAADFVERYKAYETLRASEAKYRSLFTTMEQGFCIIEQVETPAGQPSDFRYLMVNPAFEQHTGMQDVVGKTIRELLPNVEQPIMDIYNNVVRTGQPQQFEGYISELDLWIAADVLPAQQPGQIAVLFSNITERKQAEANRLRLIREQAARREAEQANRMKDEFLSMVSHELQSPLVAILGWTRLLRANPPTAAQLAHQLAIIERNATLQAKLIQDMLDISRILVDRLSLTLQPVELVPVVEGAIATIQPRATEKGIDLRFKPNFGETATTDQSKPVVMRDKDRLHQIFVNILTNAVKFTPAGGSVEVEMSVESYEPLEHYELSGLNFEANSELSAQNAALKPQNFNVKNFAKISITDTGIGISPKFLPHVFDRFLQAEKSGAAGGLGLGLAIARHLVELHHGSIEAHSTGIGFGATLIVKLPLGGHCDTV
jgi:signal transduction histidine kinase